MHTLEIIQEIQRLTITNRFFVVEETIKSIKNEDIKHQMEFAASELYNEYSSNKNLTSLTSLDLENFYETK